MKRKDLIRLLKQSGFKFVRHGGNHDIYVRENEIEKVPRHTDINEWLARAIIRKHGLHEK